MVVEMISALKLFRFAPLSSASACLATLVLLPGFSGAPAAGQDPPQLLCDSSVRPAAFAAAEIRAALAARGIPLRESSFDELAATDSGVRYVIAAGPEQSRLAAERLGVRVIANTAPQSYAIRRREADGGVTIAVLGADATGAMYGGLDIAEAIRLGATDELRDADHTPHIEKRGIKFNIPLDARSPSYSDNSDAAQYNIPVMWEFGFWREFIDQMARFRYNALTLWSLDPFPSLVRVPEFPGVALDDVKRCTIPMDDTFSGTGHDMMRPYMWDHLETVKHITIEQKMQFWRDVMQHAADRGVEVYLFTWNLFTFGTNGQYGITSDQTNETTIKYLRASVRETVLAYPLLAGLGVTAGENLRDRDDEYSKEKFLWRTYGEGVRDALKLQPGRDVTMIHRFHETGMGEILREWKDYPGPFQLSFKYALAHMYSTPKQPFIEPLLPHLSPQARTWLTVRNDDIHSFRWGDPEFARAFIKHMPGKDKIAGFYMGPDGYTLGREHLSKTPLAPRELVISKRWYSFLLWGRLSYDPGLPDELFRRMLAHRFPEAPADKLDRAWRLASKILPRFTTYFWGDLDFQWFPEACLSHPRYNGFYTIKHMLLTATMPGSGIYDLLEWRQRLLANQPMELETPLQVAADLERYASEALTLVNELRPLGAGNRELRLTLGDIEAFARLGQYYAAKTRGAADIAVYDKTGDRARQQSAERHLRRALEHWKNYARAYTSQYEQPRLYNRVGFVDIPGLVKEVEKDIWLAQTWVPGAVPDDAEKRRSRSRAFRE